MSTLEEIKGRLADHWLDADEDVNRHQVCADIATLIEAVERWGGHGDACPVTRWGIQFRFGNQDETDEPPCTCGLAEFLSTKSNQPPRAT